MRVLGGGARGLSKKGSRRLVVRYPATRNTRKSYPRRRAVAFRRRMGPDDSPPTMHLLGGFRHPLEQEEAGTGAPKLGSKGLLHEAGGCLYPKDSDREPRLHHVHLLAKTRPNHPALSIRPPGIQEDLFMAKKPTKTKPYVHPSEAPDWGVAKPDTKRAEQIRAFGESFEAKKQNLSGDSGRDGSPVGVSRKDPCHPCWKDAAFDMLDASTFVLVEPKDGSALIYWNDSPPEDHIFLRSMDIRKIYDIQNQLMAGVHWTQTKKGAVPAGSSIGPTSAFKATP
jgi:hypothetical protein